METTPEALLNVKTLETAPGAVSSVNMIERARSKDPEKIVDVDSNCVHMKLTRFRDQHGFQGLAASLAPPTGYPLLQGFLPGPFSHVF